MTFTLRANRRTIVNRLRTLASVVTSTLCLAGLSAQEPAKPPIQPPTDFRQGQPLSSQAIAEEEGRFTPPSRSDLYRVDSESTIAERIRQRRKLEGKTPVDFPFEEAMQIRTKMEPRNFQTMTAQVQASYVVYQPLYFQQINHERYGWDLGVFQPIVSTAQFYGDVLLFPYKFAANPPWHCDANVGYALPGDPEPLRFLTTPFSWRGVVGEVGVAVGGAAVFP